MSTLTHKLGLSETLGEGDEAFEDVEEQTLRQLLLYPRRLKLTKEQIFDGQDTRDPPATH